MNKKRLVIMLVIIIPLITLIVVGQSLITTGSPIPRIFMKNRSLTGTVTEKFTDCEGGQVMDRNGVIRQIEQISCDGGSYITIDYEHGFATSSGLVPIDEGYAIDVTDIQVSDDVKVIYKKLTDGRKTLNCDGCGVEKLN